MSDTPEPDEPTSEQAPIFTAGTVAAPVIRTAGQGITGAFIVQGLELFEVVELSADQAIWLTTALSIGIALAQNLIEKARGRRLVGVAV